MPVCLHSHGQTRVNVTTPQTLDQLRANAHQLEQFDGISIRMAQVIRLALAYATPFEEQTAGTKQYDAWTLDFDKAHYGTRKPSTLLIT